MTELGKLYRPSDGEPPYNDIVPVYQGAFAGYPWFEISKCPDKEKRCKSGMSRVAVGHACDRCGLAPTDPAYEEKELVDKFTGIRESRPTSWYIEWSDGNLSLAALAWRASPESIATERYPDSPGMQEWLPSAVHGNGEIMWLDEVFADKSVRPSGNLANFGASTEMLAASLGCGTVAYRTINPAMTQVARRDFSDQSELYAGARKGAKSPANSFSGAVPDWRDFVVINLNNQERL